MLDDRSYIILETILHYNQITKGEILKLLKITERQFNYDLDRLNYALKKMNLPVISSKDNKFLLDEKLKNAILSDAKKNISPNFVTISKENRVYLLYLYTFMRKEIVSNYHYQAFLGVSKNTALEDVKKTRELCEEWGLDFIYSRKDGYHVIGDEYDKRRLGLFAVNIILGTPLGNEMIKLVLHDWEYEGLLKDTQKVVTNAIGKHSFSFVKSRSSEIVTFLTFLRARNKQGNLYFPKYQKQIIARHRVIFSVGQEITKTFFGSIAVEEQYFVTLMLLISMQESGYENSLLEDLADRIIQEFERVTLLPIEDKVNLKKSLYNHLVPAFFRISFEIPLYNPLLARIKKEYSELFDFVKIALAPLSMWTGKDLSEEEIGYFTLHFGGYIERDKKRSNSSNINGLIVCSNGISTSLMLKAQLNELFPNINFLKVHSSDQIHEIPLSSYDLIFSTINVISSKPVYIVKPLLSKLEKNYLIRDVSNDFPRLNERNVTVDQIMEVINKYADIHEEEKLFSELVDLLYLKRMNKGRYAPMLSELLTVDMIKFTNEELQWRDAIRQVAKPLLDTGKIENSYVDAMIQKVEQMGAYIHVGKGIAIPHARPQEGVNQVGMSFLRTKSPVLLLDQEEHKIDIFICIAAIDNETHLKALAQLTKILGDNDKLTAIKEAETADEIKNIILKGEEK